MSIFKWFLYFHFMRPSTSAKELHLIFCLFEWHDNTSCAKTRHARGGKTQSNLFIITLLKPISCSVQRSTKKEAHMTHYPYYRYSSRRIFTYTNAIYACEYCVWNVAKLALAAFSILHECHTNSSHTVKIQHTTVLYGFQILTYPHDVTHRVVA